MRLRLSTIDQGIRFRIEQLVGKGTVAEVLDVLKLLEKLLPLKRKGGQSPQRREAEIIKDTSYPKNDDSWPQINDCWPNKAADTVLDVLIAGSVSILDSFDTPNAPAPFCSVADHSPNFYIDALRKLAPKEQQVDQVGDRMGNMALPSTDEAELPQSPG